MSVIDPDCAEAASGGLICAHIAKFYANVGGDPPVFYVIANDELPDGFTVQQTPSDPDNPANNDDCHHEIDGVGSSALKRAFKDRDIGQFFICADGGPRALTQEDVDAFPT